MSTYGSACAGLAEVQFNIGDFSTPTQDPTLKENLQVMPNPADTEIRINLNDINLDQLSIQMFNVMGQRVYSDKINTIGNNTELSIDISQFPDGQYFLKVFNQEKFATEKITVVHPR